MAKRIGFILGLLIPWLAFSQTAELSGIVKDPAGSAVLEASIEIRNQDTGIRQQTKTNRDGFYSLPALKPGTYLATVQANGFKTLTRDGIVLEVSQRARLDLTLEIGSLEEKVTVSGDVAPINSADSSVSTVVDRTFVANLPLNGRSFQSLFEITPGTVIAKSTANNTGQFNIDGQRSTSNYVMIDGVSANVGIGSNAGAAQLPAGTLAATSILGGTNNLVSVDALQEFRIQTSSFAPEYGRTPGGQVMIVTRSGANQFHGDAFEYFRNDKLDANNWFSNQSGLKRAEERQNDFGGVFGGRIRKDRTFFFLSYEGLRLLQPASISSLSVPSVAARAAAPASTRPYLAAFSLPNGQDLGNGFGVLNAAYSNPSSLNAGSVRIDHRFSDRWLLFGRYNEAPSQASPRGITTAEIDTSLNRTRTITSGVTGILSPTTVIDVHANWSDVTGSLLSTLTNFDGATPPPASLLYPVNGNAALSRFTFSVGSSLYTTGQNANNHQHQANLITTLSKTAGRHALKFGADLRWLRPEMVAPPVVMILSFAGGIGLTTPTPANGTFLSGIASSASITSNAAGFPIRIGDYSFFVQDAWRLSSRLTITYGLRWDLNPPPSAGGSGTLLAITGVQNPSTIALAPPGTPLWKTSYASLAPRIGLAYAFSRDPRSETVIRVGVGVFHDLTDGGLIAQQSLSAPNSNLQSLPNLTIPLPALTPPALPPSLPYSALYAANPNLATPRVSEYNVSLERAFGSHARGSATYVGSVGRNLGKLESLSAPNSSFANVLLSQSDASSNYNALQFQVQGTLRAGLQFLGSYSWSHSIDTASSDTATSIPLSTFLPTNIDRASSDFDIRRSGTSAVSYDLPNLRGLPIPVAALLGGWGADLMFRARSADPVNIFLTRSLGYGVFAYRPDIVPGAQAYVTDPNAGGGRRLNPAAFQVPPTLRPGDLGRNAFRGFPLAQADLAVRRQFPITESVKLQLRAEFFNLTNHPNFADPSGSFGSVNTTGAVVVPAAFGRSTMMLSSGLGGLSPIYQVGGPRSIQLALKAIF